MKMPKGVYFIGDPCYMFSNASDATWDGYLEAGGLLEEGKKDYGVFEFKGHKCWCAGTKYGDGVFKDNEGHEYCVDAGLIGVTPIELMELDEDGEETLGDLGQLETFEEDFKVECIDGVFRIGDLRIDTTSDVDEEEFEFLEDDDEEDDLIEEEDEDDEEEGDK